MQMRAPPALTADILLPALQQAMDGIIIFDHDGRVVFCNHAAEGLWGLTHTDMMGRDATLLIPACAGQAARTGGLDALVGAAREMAITRADGDYVCAELSISKVRAGKGDAAQVFYIATLKNVTEETQRRKILILQNDVVQALTGDIGMAEIGGLICRKVEGFVPDSVGILMVRDDTRPEWRVICTSALPPRIRTALESGGPSAVDLEKLAATPSYAGRLAWDSYQSLCRSLGLQSCYAAPVMGADGQVGGIFALYLRGANHLGAWPQRLVGACAPFCALAMEQQAARTRITRLARFDMLTGLLNRSALHQALTDAIARSGNRRFAVFMLDIDRFHDINDALGHIHGDEFLMEIARRLRSVAQDDYILSRSGGDEFVMVVPDCHGERIANVAGDLIAAISRPFHIARNMIGVTCCIGVSTFPANGPDSESLLSHADAAMRQARHDGCGGFHVASPTKSHATPDRLLLGAALRDTVAHHGLELHYQPQVHTRTLDLTGVEALARWHHPRLGNIFPSRFIAVAEETGQIEAIGQWALLEACRQIVKWDRDGIHVPTVAVNLSAVHFRNQTLPAYIDALLKDHGLSPARLTVEITESVTMDSSHETESVLHAVRALGCGLSMDDFGTGYSSLSRLTRLPLTEIKMDRSFIHNFEHDTNVQAVTMAVIGIGRRLGMTGVGEGVETAEQRALLEELDCDVMQGYLFARPLTPRKMEQWVRDGGGPAAIRATGAASGPHTSATS